MSVADLWTAMALQHAPVWPSAQSLLWARHVLWSVVIVAVGFKLAARFSHSPKWLGYLPWLLAPWAWVPGPWGASYWLSLAFQMPSLSAAFLALAVMLRRASYRTTGSIESPQASPRWSIAWAVMAVVTGTLLLLDTFAVFDFSIYQWGFSTMAFVIALGIALLPWIVSGKKVQNQPAVWSLIAALMVFLVTRWPTGNVWDAVLDPFLWLLSLAYLLRRPWRKA